MSRARDLVLQLEGIARAMACAPSEAALGRAACRALEPVVAFRGCALCLLDRHDGQPRIVWQRGFEPPEAGPPTPLHAVVASGTTLLIPPGTLEPGLVESLGSPWIRSLVVQPVESRGRTVGAVALASDRSDAFDEFDLAITAFVAKLAGAAWERIRQEASVHLRNAVLSALARVTERLAEENAWDDAVNEVVERLGTVLDCSRCYLFEIHEGGQGQILASQRYEWAAEGIAPEIANPDLQDFPMVEGGFARWCRLLGEGRPVVGLVREFPPAEREFLSAQGIRSILVVPIVEHDRWWGFLGFDDCARDRDWTRMEIDTLKTAANALGVAVRGARLRLIQRLHAQMLDAVGEAIVATEADGRIVYWNCGAERMLGWTSAEVVGRPLTDLPLGAEARVALGPPPSLALGAVEVTVLDNRGRGRPVLCTLAPLREAANGPEKHVHVLVDLSRLKQAQRQVARGARRLQLAVEGTVGALLRLVEARDPDLAWHHHRVAELSLALAQRMGLDRDRQQATWVAALLHDIGKLCLPPAPSGGGEPPDAQARRRRVREHVRLGAWVLSPLDLPWPVATIVGQHHERADGRGYPARLPREAIQREAAIIAVADILERKARAVGADGGPSLEPCLAALRRERGRRLDPEVVDACLALAAERNLIFPIRGDDRSEP